MNNQNTRRGNTQIVVKNQVILNLIQDLQRFSLPFINNMRGRCQIKFGMTPLFNNRGFTLIELLVVVLIIGILAAVALPQYRVAVEKSRYATLKNLVHSIADAQNAYYLANGKYADDFEKLDITLPGGKLNTSTKNLYEYDWGKCRMGGGGDQSICHNQKMSYQMWLPYSPAYGIRECVVLGTADTSDFHNLICKQETQKAAPDRVNTDGTNYIVWSYKRY